MTQAGVCQSQGSSFSRLARESARGKQRFDSAHGDDDLPRRAVQEPDRKLGAPPELSEIPQQARLLPEYGALIDMAGTSLLDVWDAIETLSDRGKPIAYPRQSTRSLSFPTAIITLTTLAVAAVPLVLLNPERVDGLPMLLSLFLFPMMAGGLIIELVVLCELQRQEPHWNLLWWPLVALPTGLLIMSIGPVLAYPDYFDVTSSTSAVGVMMMFTLLILLGLGLSFLFWPFVVLPLRILGLAAVDARRGERIAAFRIYTPFILLAVPTISLVAVASLDDMEANRAAAGQVVLALLGIPGEYETAWEPGLWIVRGITLALIGSAAWARASSSARNKQNTGKTGA